MLLLSSADFFQNNFSKKIFQEQYQGVKWFGSWSGPTFCGSWSGSKLFAKVISRRQVDISKDRVILALLRENLSSGSVTRKLRFKSAYSVTEISLNINILHAAIKFSNYSVQKANNKDTDQTVKMMCRLVCTFAVHMQQDHCSSWQGQYMYSWSDCIACAYKDVEAGLPFCFLLLRRQFYITVQTAHAY